MLKIIVLVVLLLPLAAAHAVERVPAQGSEPVPDSGMHKLLISTDIAHCQSYILSAQKLIPDYYRRGLRDSVDMILAYVDSTCPPVRNFVELRTLLQIEDGMYSDEDLCESGLAERMVKTGGYGGSLWIYQYMLQGGESSHQNTGWLNFEVFLEEVRRKLLGITDSNRVAYLVLRHYGGDYRYIFDRLKRGDFGGSCIEELYHHEVARLVRDRYDFRSIWAFNLGAWAPLGENDILGNKIEFGGLFGGRWDRWGGDLIGVFRAIKAPNDYVVRHNGDLVATDYYFGGYVGAHLTYSIFRNLSRETELLAGAGYDGFDAVHEGSDDNERTGIGSLNLNVGVTQRFYVDRKKEVYVGIQGRYNVVWYDSDGGSDLSGNTISVNLLIGKAASWVNRRLDELGYFGRE